MWSPKHAVYLAIRFLRNVMALQKKPYPRWPYLETKHARIDAATSNGTVIGVKDDKAGDKKCREYTDVG